MNHEGDENGLKGTTGNVGTKVSDAHTSGLTLIPDALVDACTLAFDDSLSEVEILDGGIDFSYGNLPKERLLQLLCEKDIQLAECTITIRELRASFAREFREKLTQIQHQQLPPCATLTLETSAVVTPRRVPARLRHVSFSVPAPTATARSSSVPEEYGDREEDWFDIFV